MSPTVQDAVVDAANMTWQRGGDRAVLLELANDPRVNVLALVECRLGNNEPLDVGAILRPLGWIVRQNLHSGATAGTALAVRRSSGIKVRNVRNLLASLAGHRPGRAVQARYLKVCKLRDAGGPFTLGILHTALESSGQQDDGVRAARRWWRRTRGRKALAGDMNMRPGKMAELIGAAHAYGADPMALLWSDGWHPSATTGKRWVHPLDHMVLRWWTDLRG